MVSFHALRTSRKRICVIRTTKMRTLVAPSISEFLFSQVKERKRLHNSIPFSLNFCQVQALATIKKAHKFEDENLWSALAVTGYKSRSVYDDGSLLLISLYWTWKCGLNNNLRKCICCGSVLSLVQILFSFVFRVW